MSFLDIDQIEAAARRLRQLLGIDDEVRPDMMYVLERMTELRLITAYELDEESLPDGKEGSFNEETGVLRIRATEARGINLDYSKSRFTVAHEVGHAWFRHEGINFRTAASAKPKATRNSREEIQANYFAAAFLAPAHLVGVDPHKMTVREIAERFNISRSAAEFRKPELERLYRQQNKLTRELPSSVVDFLKEAASRGHSIRSLAQTPKRPMPVATRQAAATIEEACASCGWPRVEPQGSTRVRCPECKNVYDRFQDGDSVNR